MINYGVGYGLLNHTLLWTSHCKNKHNVKIYKKSALYYVKVQFALWFYLSQVDNQYTAFNTELNFFLLQCSQFLDGRLQAPLATVCYNIYTQF